MTGSKLIEILSTLSQNEWQQLSRHLSKANNSRALQLFDALYSHYPNIHENCHKANIFQQCYPNAVYDDQRIREDMAMLFKELKKFLVMKELDPNSFEFNRLLLKQLRKRKLKKSFETHFKKGTKQLNEADHIDEELYLNRYWLYDEGDQYFGQQQTRAFDANLQQKVANLDQYYFALKLKESCEMLNRSRIIGANYEMYLVEDVLRLTRQNQDYLDSPIIKVYYQVYQMLSNDEDESFFKNLLDLLGQHHQVFQQLEARNIYRYAQNYCIRQINKGNPAYFGELLNIYKTILGNSLILENDYLDHTDYKNIITVGLRQQEVKWVEEFLESYRFKLFPQFRESAYQFNKASFCYETERYDEAIDLLNQGEFKDLFYYLSARHLLMKIYYETDEDDALHYLIDSFRVYLGRNKKLSAANKNGNLNLLKLIRRISRLRNEAPYLSNESFKHKQQKIQKALQTIQPIANQRWLHQKLAEITTKEIAN